MTCARAGINGWSDMSGGVTAGDILTSGHGRGCAEPYDTARGAPLHQDARLGRYANCLAWGVFSPRGLRAAEPASFAPVILNNLDVTTRVRIILGLHADQPFVDEQIEGCAQRLNVSELDLRATIDLEAPRPAVSVMVAVVRSFGIDPMWLITGEYNAGTHHEAIQGSSAEVESLIRSLMHRSTTAPRPGAASQPPRV